MSKLEAMAKNFDWFIAPFAPVVIGRSYFFSIGFPQSFETHSYEDTTNTRVLKLRSLTGGRQISVLASPPLTVGLRPYAHNYFIRGVEVR